VNGVADSGGSSMRGSGWADDDASALLSALPGAVLVMVDRRIVFANPAALELFGVRDLEALAEREAARAHVLSEDRSRIDRRLDAIEQGHTVSPSVEYRILRPDGTVRVVEWSTLPIQFAGRAALLCSVDDVTMLALTRDTLDVSERHQREVIATLAEGVIVVDRLGMCSDANPAAARMLGLDSPEQLVGVHADLMPMVNAVGEPLPHAQHPVWRALENGEQIRNEMFLIRFPNRLRRMRVSTIPIVSSDDSGAGAVVTFDDVTLQFEEQERTARSEERFRNLAAIAPVAVFETDPDGLCTYVNDRWSSYSGLDSDTTLGTHWTAAVHPNDIAAVELAWSEATHDPQPFRAQFTFRHLNGAATFVSCEAAPIIDVSGAINGWIGTATDLSAELSLREELRASEQRFRTLVEHSPDTVVRVLLNPWRIGYISPSIVDLTGCERDQFYADPTLLAGFIHPDDLERVTGLFRASQHVERLDFRLVHRDGSIRTVDVRSQLISTAGNPVSVEATMRDISQRVTAHDTLERLAHQDELTGISNRRAIVGALELRLAARRPTSVIFLDLDGFKRINDTYGHDAGDEVLQAVGKRLTAALRNDDQVGRIGGDEFVVISDPSVAHLLARRLTEHLAPPIQLSRGVVVTVGASVGVNDFDPDGPTRTPDDLLRHADQAMYRTKITRPGHV
jgi:diguanylate cyclase (GGDEF)-like protein/PAS domain S-box-containing protein